MTSTTTSADGTRIAYERLGAGATVILVPGILCTRETVRPLAEQLADALTVFIYDRRGRGGSSDTAPYAVEREFEDLEAIVTVAGGTSALYGHSSGAGLVLRAVAAGVPAGPVVLHEPPYGPDDEASRKGAAALGREIAACIAEDRRADALIAFLSAAGMPAEMAAQAAKDPGMLEVAPTMPYDFEVQGNVRTGGAIPAGEAAKVPGPVLVLAGGASPPFFLDTARRLAELLPDGRLRVLDGQDHAAAPDVVAPAVAEFLATAAG
ncbi:alpha/beta hydrolase [Streptomyces sp. A7024]|uniref:Alpha/beta hydrolase n=1 Tax=Streptomyces coryli TaxID=1128680 RepID=A0A6G4TYT1_9ACTN|nr:alpha/beta fold hydrolase [Streptomyces coryli]NGN64606.1 alpha/beta hydrolase [Streptomyces coryli]